MEKVIFDAIKGDIPLLLLLVICLILLSFRQNELTKRLSNCASRELLEAKFSECISRLKRIEGAVSEMREEVGYLRGKANKDG